MEKIRKISICLISSFFMILVTTTCQHENNLGYPVVFTGEVTDISSDGAVFHAKIIQNGNYEIIDHGFVWDTQNTPNLESSYSYSIGKLNSTNITLDVNHFLEPESEYYVRAYLKIQGKIIYGRTVSFRSKGSSPSNIYSIEPLVATWGDSIIISGSYFSPKANHNKVFFGNKEAQVYSFDEDHLAVIVPYDLDEQFTRIGVSVLNNLTFFKDDFALEGPKIRSFSLEYGMANDTLILYGDFFHNDKNRNEVFFGNGLVDVLHSEKTKLIIRIPFNTGHGEFPILVKINDMQTELKEIFMVYEPWRKLRDFPFEERFGAMTFKIGNELYVGGGNYKYNSIVGWNQHRNISFYKYDPASDRWDEKAQMFFLNYDMTHGEVSTFFSTNNYAYVFWGKQVYRYDPATDVWEHYTNYPGRAHQRQASFSIGSKGYVFDGFSDSGASNECYEFDEVTSTWKRLKSFPYSHLNYLIGFSIVGKGYTAMGSLYDANNDHILQYDPSTDQWSYKYLLSEKISVRTTSALMVVGEKAYIGFGRFGTVFHKDIYEYCSAKNDLQRIADFPGEPRAQAFGFSMGDKGYFGGGKNATNTFKDFYEFDPSKLPPNPL